ncbi:DOMON domain-containing protein [Crocinitomix catalasitica]|uniref:DOMON domain-containing protein n=1 Tax=Crocinitomix catalasitica TaxID=184607 RepID=UPI0004861945|nr:DOMON domain-containing protein [Crocinitomix catalasitica]
MKYLIFFTLLGFGHIEKNKMKVDWSHADKLIHFTISAPADGWVAIGLNNKQGITGTYLLMGRVKNGVAEVVEHSTLSPGNYKSFKKIGVSDNVLNISGTEDAAGTRIQFSLPVEIRNKYQKSLENGKQYYLTIAYSQSDDFQHHSIMRTQEKITL